MESDFTDEIGWSVVEQLGHKRLGGYVRSQEIAGKAFLRIDVPDKDGEGTFATQYVSPDTIYCLTPTTETMARAVARLSQPEPVHRWELPSPADVEEAEFDAGSSAELEDIPF